ncbi:unnamed protein product, partial [Owenia fusiformis]
SHPVHCAVDENITELQMSKLKTDIQEIKEEVVLGKRKYDEMEVKSNGLKNTNAKLRKTINRLTKEKMAAVETSESYLEDVNMLQQTREELVAQMEQLEHMIQEAQAEATAARQRESEKTAELAETRSELKNVKEKLQICKIREQTNHRNRLRAESINCWAVEELRLSQLGSNSILQVSGQRSTLNCIAECK